MLKDMTSSSLELLLALFFLRFNNCFSYITPISSNPDNVQFLLYTNQSGTIKEEELVYKNKDSITSSSFQNQLPTVILIHGFWCDRYSNFPLKLRNAYLESLPSTQNYIVVDWGALSRVGTTFLAENLIYPMLYPLVVQKSIPIVSIRITEFIQFLIQNDFTSLSRLHIVGHSLGAHISGYVGHLLQKIGMGKVQRITGLDAAGPFFDQGIKIQRNLVKKDAQFVDVYHTAMGTRGDSTIDGHVDFYPNGGVLQPPCKILDSESPPLVDLFSRGSCSHEYVVDIYASTLTRNYTACQCNPQLSDVDLNNCLLDCPNPITPGERCPVNAHGLYWFGTD